MNTLVAGGLGTIGAGLVDDEVDRRREILDSVVLTEERLLRAFPSDFCHTDNQGGQITREHIQRYLRGHREHYVELISQVLTWTSGIRIAEIGVAYGLTLLCLRDFYGFEVHGYELPSNIPIYCKGLQEAAIPVEGWDLHDEKSPSPNGKFDMVICSEVVEHLYINLSAVLERIRPILRVAGSRLLLTTPNIYAITNIVKVLRGMNICQDHPSVPLRRNDLVIDAREHPREYTFSEVRQAFSAPYWRLHKIWSHGSFRTRSVRGLILYRLLRLILPYPVNRVIFALGERIA